MSLRSTPSRVASRPLLALLLVLLAGGCKVGPDYRPQQPQLPQAWFGPTVKPSPAEVAAQDLARWWTVFQDPLLTSLVARAGQSNLSVKQAESRIRQARAARQMTAAGLGPSLAGLGAFSRSRSAGSGFVGNQFQAGLDAGWEIDIFGGTRREVEAADAEVLASIENRRAVLVSLTAEVALAYLDLRSYQQRIVIAQDNLVSQRKSGEVTRKRFQGGFVSGLDVANAEAQEASIAAQIPTLRTAAQQAVYSLGVLLGQSPAALEKELAPVAQVPVAPPEVPTGVPADLLRRRPDIRQAEAQIHAATALIGAATSDLLPKFTLSGMIGYQSNRWGTLNDWPNRFWSFGPGINWQLFDSGRILANIRLNEAVRDETVFAYQQTVLTAMQEVENALVAAANEQEHRRLLTNAVTSYRRALTLSTRLYAEGQTEYLNVLEAQRSQYTSEQALMQSNRDLSADLVALYKALGGGWEEDKAAPAGH